MPYYATGTALSKLGIGTANQILTVNSGGTAPQWSTLSGVAVTTFSAGTTGFTPNTATSGAITLSGTLATTNGGTGLTAFTSGGAVYATSTSALTTGTLPVTAGGTGVTAVTAGYVPFGSTSTALNSSANFFWDNTNKRLGIGTATPAVTFAAVGTDAMLLPKGTTLQQPTGVAGYLRFNTDTTQFEGYNGTAWSSVGGAAISNDTTTSTNEYPLFASATSGTALTVYTSNAKLLYKPSTGEFQASVPVASNGIFVNSQTVAASYTIAAGYSGSSTGPVTVAGGQSVTVSSGSRWVVL